MVIGRAGDGGLLDRRAPGFVACAPFGAPHAMSQPDLSRLRIQRDDSAPRPPRLFWPWIAIAVVALGATAWAILSPRGTEVRVALASATGGGTATSAGITANGYVVARTKASVSGEVMGRLQYLGVEEGSVVRKGDVIARIQSADYLAALNAARARVQQLRLESAQAQRDLERAEKLNHEGAIAATEVENARTRRAS